MNRTGMSKWLLAGLLMAGSASAKTIVFGLSGEPISLDPAVTADGNTAYVQTQIYNSLISFKPGTVDLQPDLALRWTVSSDSLTWTFYLRQNVKFHDGTPLNADAVRFNFMRWWDPSFEFGAKKAFLGWKNNLGGYKGEDGSIVKDIKVRNAYTVDIILNKPYPALDSVLADSGLFGIASPTAIKKNPLQYGTPAGLAVGTGPFVLKKWTSGVNVELTRNPSYFRAGYPKSEALLFRFFKDPSGRLNELLTGGVDIATELLPDQLKSVQSNVKLNAVLRPALNLGYLGLNTAYKPLTDVRVRTAIASALNKKAIVDTFWNGLGITDGHLLPPPLATNYAKGVTDYKFDPAGAKKMLADAGYPNGFTLDLWYMPVSRPYYPTPKPIAEAMAADLSAIGIKVTLKTEDWAKYLEDRQNGKFQAFMLGYVYATDPDNGYTNLFAPGSTTDINWNSPEATAALDSARKLPNAAQRLPFYQKVDEILFNAAVRIPIVHSRLLVASGAGVKGWIPSPTGSEKLDTVEK
ncbi:ABC transporter substrate-binding protein [Deinococcus marmoris]|uniref:Dipeptide-binding ABC transporter, periplasmic substrate-binding component n=1 Tax=Deinococcus marmoris TaxID=249408 RepID=A0A1U7P360_9DEIO|nr:Dipeptide-binding ABC transporter, periplasmic substrate-binding component [Deinococcus marmoris]